MTKKLSVEEAKRNLTPRQLSLCSEYIRLYADIAAKRVPAYQAYLNVTPDCDSNHVARVRTAEFMRYGSTTREYVDAVLQQQGTDPTPPIRTIDETRADLEAMAKADITDIVAWDVIEREDGSIVHIPKIMKVEELDPAARRLIKSVTFTKNGPKLELHDQLKAQDMLNRMRGAYVDRLEVSGPNGGPIRVEMSGEVKLEIKKLLDEM